MVSPPTISTSAIDLNLKVKNCTSFYCTFKDRLVIKKKKKKTVQVIWQHFCLSLSFRVSFTTSGTIRSLPSPQKPSPCRPRSTKWCTSACPPSLPTLQASSTTELESSPRTSLMTWWALSSECTSSIHRHDFTLIYNLSVATDPEIISHPTQHQNVWSFHPGGDTHIPLIL